jgi:hypothetical protein
VLRAGFSRFSGGRWFSFSRSSTVGSRSLPPAAFHSPTSNQQLGAFGHQPARGFGAIEVAVDLVAHDGFKLHHFSP